MDIIADIHLHFGEALWRFLLVLSALLGALAITALPGIRGVAQPLRNELDACCKDWLPQGSGPTTLLAWWKLKRAAKRDAKLAEKGYEKRPAAPAGAGGARPAVQLDLPKAIALAGLIAGNTLARLGVIAAITYVLVAGL